MGHGCLDRKLKHQETRMAKNPNDNNGPQSASYSHEQEAVQCPDIGINNR